MTFFGSAALWGSCVAIAVAGAQGAKAAAVSNVTQAFVRFHVSEGLFAPPSPTLAVTDVIFATTLGTARAGDGSVRHAESFSRYGQGFQAAIAAQAEIGASGAATVSYTAEITATVTNLAATGTGAGTFFYLLDFSAFDRHGLLPISSVGAVVLGAMADDMTREEARFASSVTFDGALIDRKGCATGDAGGFPLPPSGAECGPDSPDFSTVVTSFTLDAGESRDFSWTLSVMAEAATFGVTPEAVPVPAPSPAPILAAGLLGLALSLRRRGSP
ncbi:hypothetical protein [Elioraea rosea]|uniref:hypothetical protein n=1 Tax=Elioraea rosea TaxID=2492390 RepID=UPI001181FE12|nr:hypothetical protein [Elioraea rosea]